jgi:hypothetical protein
MRFLGVRFTIRRAMVAVAAMAWILASFRPVWIEANSPRDAYYQWRLMPKVILFVMVNVGLFYTFRSVRGLFVRSPLILPHDMLGETKE